MRKKGLINNEKNKVTQDKMIGMIVCKQDNKYVIKFCSDEKFVTR